MCKTTKPSFGNYERIVTFFILHFTHKPRRVLFFRACPVAISNWVSLSMFAKDNGSFDSGDNVEASFCVVQSLALPCPR